MRVLAEMMPKGLYARALIIIIAPIVILQSVVAFVFMERHWQTVTRRLSAATVRDIAALTDLIETYPGDDNAAEIFWSESGGNAIIGRVKARYGLSGTSAPYDGHWWTTMSTTADLVRYYDMLLDGAGGLPPEQAAVILSDLSASTPNGLDGYPQRFGIPDGLFAEPVAVKQGWMPGWNGNNWLHMSTGVIGRDRRFVIAIASMQPVDDASARNTLTQAIKTMFPGGRI